MSKYIVYFILGRMYCWLRGVSFGKGLRTFGRPLIRKHPQARIICEDHVVLNSDSRSEQSQNRKLFLNKYFEHFLIYSLICRRSGCQVVQQRRQSQEVAAPAKAADLPHADWRDE